MTIDSKLQSTLKEIFSDGNTNITVLTGAGISAESGIPTFRGPEGFWTIGSKVYMPQEVATLEMFRQHPQEVWDWYLYRLGVCLHAEPNAGHHALADMERILGNRFSLITQNIDNLHIRAGNSLDRTYQIHGNINYTRCSRECSKRLLPLANELKIKRDKKGLNNNEIQLLRCRDCGNWLRPHVLWFDEYYDEEYFRYESSIEAAGRTELLIIAGTSGATSLPNQIASIVLQMDKMIIDINIEENPFSDMAKISRNGTFLKKSSAQILPALVNLCSH